MTQTWKKIATVSLAAVMLTGSLKPAAVKKQFLSTRKIHQLML